MHSRQTGALLFCACSVPAVLLLPKLHPAAVVLASAAAIGLWALLQKQEIEIVSRPAGLFCVLLLALCLGRAAQFTAISYPTAEHRLWLNLILLALGVYASAGGLERIVRVSAICFLFLIPIYSLIAVFSLKNINVIYPTGLLQPEIGNTALVWVLLPMILWLNPRLRIKQGKGPWAAGLFLLLILPTILVWLSQSRDFAWQEAFPFYAMVKTIRAFRVMERFEPILSSALTAGNFCLVSALSVMAREVLKHLLPRCGETGEGILLFAAGAALNMQKSVLLDIMIGVFALPTAAMILLTKQNEKKMKKTRKTC